MCVNELSAVCYTPCMCIGDLAIMLNRIVSFSIVLHLLYCIESCTQQAGDVSVTSKGRE